MPHPFSLHHGRYQIQFLSTSARKDVIMWRLLQRWRKWTNNPTRKESPPMVHKRAVDTHLMHADCHYPVPTHPFQHHFKIHLRFLVWSHGRFSFSGLERGWWDCPLLFFHQVLPLWTAGKFGKRERAFNWAMSFCFVRGFRRTWPQANQITEEGHLENAGRSLPKSCISQTKKLACTADLTWWTHSKSTHGQCEYLPPDNHLTHWQCEYLPPDNRLSHMDKCILH